MVRRRPAAGPGRRRPPRPAGTSSRRLTRPAGRTPTPTWDAKLRLERMDEYGVWAQVLYPNVALFNSALLQETGDLSMTFEYIQAYNDFQTEWCSAAPDRLIAVTTLPFWDLDATLAEIERCEAMGHRGIVFSQDPSAFGLPHLTDPHWDRCGPRPRSSASR